ncbi:hypothetical protein Godav_009993, partial [Gossypium davidsonii]|nr:hypothetical protein [Gossypium davidsonii]MBA0660265.1 hypothetical protein [Gossypium klotzschianum]
GLKYLLAHFRPDQSRHFTSPTSYSGVLGIEEQHQSIPNLVVKLYCGDDTVGEGTPGNRSS